MPITAAVVPEAVVVLEGGVGIPEHVVREFVEVFRMVGADHTGVIAGDVGSFARSPPTVVLAVAPDDAAVVDEPAVSDLKPRGLGGGRLLADGGRGEVLQRNGPCFIFDGERVAGCRVDRIVFGGSGSFSRGRGAAVQKNKLGEGGERCRHEASGSGRSRR